MLHKTLYFVKVTLSFILVKFYFSKCTKNTIPPFLPGKKEIL